MGKKIEKSLYNFKTFKGGVAELVDAVDSKSTGVRSIRVRVPSSLLFAAKNRITAQYKKYETENEKQKSERETEIRARSKNQSEKQKSERETKIRAKNRNPIWQLFSPKSSTEKSLLLS